MQVSKVKSHEIGCQSQSLTLIYFNCDCTFPGIGLVAKFNTEKDGLTEKKLDMEITRVDMLPIARCFARIPNDATLDKLLLDRADIGDAKRKLQQEGIEEAVVHILTVWHRVNPSNATFGTLIDVLLDPTLKDSDTPESICKWIARNVDENRELN